MLYGLVVITDDYGIGVHVLADSQLSGFLEDHVACITERSLTYDPPPSFKDERCTVGVVRPDLEEIIRIVDENDLVTKMSSRVSDNYHIHTRKEIFESMATLFVEKKYLAFPPAKGV